MAEGVSPSARIAAAYKSLAASAEVLNTVSDQFAKPVSQLDDALQKLNIGLTTWERTAGDDDDGCGYYWSRDVGYAKVGNKWGLAIRETSGHHNDPEGPGEVVQLFNDAPRSHRIEALDKIPDLVERLVKVADKTAKKLKEKMAEASDLVNAIQQAEAELNNTRAFTVTSK